MKLGKGRRKDWKVDYRGKDEEEERKERGRLKGKE